MGNELSAAGEDGGPDTGTGPSVPSTPRPILRNPGTQQSNGSEEMKNRRSVVFRDQTEDALRLNHSIVRAGGGAGTGHQRAPSMDQSGGLARLSKQVNDINGGLRRSAEGTADAGIRRGVRTQKPPAPAPPPQQQQQHRLPGANPSSGGEYSDQREKAANAPEDANSPVSRMREHVFALADRKASRKHADAEDGGGRLYDPSAPELPTVAEERDEMEESGRRSHLHQSDSKEALKEEIKQEILSELLNHSSPAVAAAPSSAKPRGAGGEVVTKDEKSRLIAEIRQQLLGDRRHPPQGRSEFGDGIPEPDYPDGPYSSIPQPREAGDFPGEFEQEGYGVLPERRMLRAASELEIRAQGANGHYRGPPQRRYKGPAPAPPNARYRRSGGGPATVRDPYQAQWEEPIYAYDSPQAEQLQEQMEKEYDDRYRQKSRSKSRFGDSWKRMTASLSKAFGFGQGGGGGGGAGKSGVTRRSSVRDSTFEGPSNLQQLSSGSRASSIYSLAQADLPPPSQPHGRRPQFATPEDIWRDVARASHDQMLHTANPVFGAEATTAADSGPVRNGRAAAADGYGDHRDSNKSWASAHVTAARSAAAPAAAATVVPAAAAATSPKVNAFREQTYL